ncbi:methyl-accepting chemotaxis protein [Pseudoduganella aquatica]|uniref:methyl-accepting chemotaxis protein n=1 Tax=Pseudoduganella aquatica TaxID=2660641 RepID=UPI002AA29FE0|nr:methyl-accepting chemotaxis protein [Pseudoduganella aquatica]
MSKVDAGNVLAADAGKAMSEVVDSVRRITTIMSDIVHAAQEQSSGIEQVNQAITQIDEMTQQNAALVEQAAAASESLREQAGALSDAVAVFTLQENEAAHAPHAPKRPAARPLALVRSARAG